MAFDVGKWASTIRWATPPDKFDACTCCFAWKEMATVNPNKLVHPENPADGLLSPEHWMTLAQLFELSDRERTVAQLLFDGESREQIALLLRKPDGTNLSPETVRVYIDRLLRKLNVTDPMQMAIRILRVQRDCLADGSVTDSVTRNESIA